MTEEAAERTKSRTPFWRLAPVVVALAGCFSVLAYSGWLQTGVEFIRLGVRDIDRKLNTALGRPLPGTPDLSRLAERLKEKGARVGSPLFMRIFKQEYELEVWTQQGDRFVHFATYPICTYSGELGPKLRQGDRQSPEGFYTVSRAQLNPNSRWHRSFNLGYPNIYDASHGRTGSLLMVHGGCASIGCYAMTNAVIDELWTLINGAYDGGQSLIAVHVFPFRMSDWRMSAHGQSEWMTFWSDLKRGYDLFEQSRIPPAISVCDKRYHARLGALPSTGAEALRSACPNKDEASYKG